TVVVTVQWFTNNTFRVTTSVGGTSYPAKTGWFIGGTPKGSTTTFTPKHVTAECIAEAPKTSSGQQLPLANFDPVTFSNCQMTSSGGTQYAIADAPQHGSQVSR